MDLKELFPEIDWEKVDSRCLLESGDFSRDELAREIASMANTNGGVFVIGSSPSGEATGFDLDSLENAKSFFLGLFKNFIDLQVPYRFILRSVDDWAENYVLAILIDKSATPLYCLERGKKILYVREDGKPILKRSPCPIARIAEFSSVHFDRFKWSRLDKAFKGLRFEDGQSLTSSLMKAGLVNEMGFVRNALLPFQDLSSMGITKIVCHVYDEAKIRELDRREFADSILSNVEDATSFAERTISRQLNLDSDRAHNFKQAFRQTLLFAFAHKDYENGGEPLSFEIWNGNVNVSAKGSLLKESEDGKWIKKVFEIIGLLEDKVNPLTEIYGNCQKARLLGEPELRIREYDFSFSLSQRLGWKGETKTLGRPLKGDLQKGREEILKCLKQGPMAVKELQKLTPFTSRAYFLKVLIIPLVQDGVIEKVGDRYSPTSYYQLTNR